MRDLDGAELFDLAMIERRDEAAYAKAHPDARGRDVSDADSDRRRLLGFVAKLRAAVLNLSPETVLAIDVLASARGVSRSGVVEALVREEMARR